MDGYHTFRIFEVSNTGLPSFVELLFIIAVHRRCVFNKLKVTTGFIAILTFLQWSGTKPTISPRYAYILAFCSHKHKPLKQVSLFNYENRDVVSPPTVRAMNHNH